MPMTVVYRVIAYGCGMGDPGRNLGDFALRQEAEQFAIRKGELGGDASVVTIPAVEIDGHTFELASPSPLTINRPITETF